MATVDTDITEALRNTILQQVGRERFDLWFGPNARLVLSDSSLTIEVATPLFQDWLRANFGALLRRCCQQVAGRPLDLEFRVNPELASPSGAATVDAERSDDQELDNETSIDDRPSTAISQQEKNASESRPPRGPMAASAKSRNSAARRTRTLRKLADFDSFAVGHCNRVAYAAAQMAAERPGSASPLLLYGPTGAGKTHLLESIHSAVMDADPTATALYLGAEQFTTLFLEALHHSGLPSFRRKYRNVELLVLDDIHFFAGKTATIGELLHTIDTLLRNEKQVVLASDCPPADLDELGPEMASRLSGGMVCRLETPDQPVRREIVRRYATKIGLEIPDKVQQMIAARFTENSRQLFGAIHRLVATSQALESPILPEMAEEALADLTLHSSRVIQLSDIEQAVCDVFGLEPESLKSAKRLKAISQPRMLAMWLARKHTRSALVEIGGFFGNRSHTTVISANRRVTQWMENGERLEFSGSRWQIEEAIRRVEQKLRAG